MCVGHRRLSSGHELMKDTGLSHQRADFFRYLILLTKGGVYSDGEFLLSISLVPAPAVFTADEMRDCQSTLTASSRLSDGAPPTPSTTLSRATIIRLRQRSLWGSMSTYIDWCCGIASGLWLVS